MAAPRPKFAKLGKKPATRGPLWEDVLADPTKRGGLDHFKKDAERMEAAGAAAPPVLDVAFSKKAFGGDISALFGATSHTLGGAGE